MDDSETWSTNVNGPHPAWLDMDDAGYEGFLYFHDPVTKENHCVRVTLGITYSTDFHHVWHMEHNGRELIVSPSIWFHGHFHTPNPVSFRLISRKEYERS